MNDNKSFRLFLLRHGNTFEAGQVSYQIGCQTDLPLTSKGLFQAQNFAAYLRSQQCHPQIISCGILKRQTQTAEILKTQFPRAKLLTHPALNEIDYGAWEGLTTEQIVEKWPQEYQAWQDQSAWPQHVFPKNLAHHTELLKTWLQMLHEEVPDKGIVIAVSSGGILKLLLQFVPQLWQELAAKKELNAYKVGTGHYCELMCEGTQLQIKSWNCKP